MSQCEARVVAVSGSEVWVEVAGRPPCGNCKTADACQTGLLGLTTGPRRYRLDNRIGAQVGDQVQLTVAEGTLWRASLWSYGVPLLLAIGGAVIGQSVSGDEAAVAGTVVGLVFGLGLLRRDEVPRAARDLFSLQVPTQEIRFEDSHEEISHHTRAGMRCLAILSGPGPATCRTLRNWSRSRAPRWSISAPRR